MIPEQTYDLVEDKFINCLRSLGWNLYFGRTEFQHLHFNFRSFSTESAFIETVFHEGAHIIYSKDSKFRSRIYFMSQELNRDFPRGLWHASLFYLCGRLVQDKLKVKGIKHSLTMDVNQ